MIANIGVNLLGTLTFLFIFWKKMKEDYVSEIIFSVAFIILGGMLLGYVVSLRFFPSWFFYSEFVGVLLGLTACLLRYRLRVYETFEAVVVSILPWLSLLFLRDSVANSSLISLIAFFVILLLVLCYYFLDLKYKNFHWYRSGRLGFSGLAITGIFFLVRSSVSIFYSGVLSFVGKFEPYLGGVLGFLAFLLIFNLGRSEV